MFLSKKLQNVWPSVIKTILFLALLGLVVYAGLFLAQTLIVDENERYIQGQRAEAVQFNSALRTVIEQNLNERLFLISGLKAFVVSNKYEFETEEFNRFAEAMAEDNLLVRSIQLAPDGVVSEIYPLEGNEAALGHNLLVDDRRKDNVFKAIENNAYIVTGPITLLQGGEALIARLPIYDFGSSTENSIVTTTDRLDSFWGFATVLIDVDSLYSIIQERLANSKYEVAIRGRHALGAEGEVFYGEESIFSQNPVLNEVTLPVGSWQLAIVPKDGWPTTSPTSQKIIFMIWGLTFTLFLLMVSLVLARYRALRLVRIRTKELQKTNTFQEAILDSALNSIIATDVNGTITAFNKGAEAMLGYTASEVIQKETPAIIHEPAEVVAHAKELSKEYNKEIQPGFEVFVLKAKEGKPETKRWTYIKKTGERITVLLSVTALRDQSDVIVGFLGIAADISEQVAAERELERFKLAVDSATDGVIITSPEGEVVYVNPAWEKTTGYKAKEIVNKNPSVLQSGKTPPEVYETMWKKITKGESFITEEVVNRRKNGDEYAVRLAIYPIRRSGRIEYYVGLEQDITNRKLVDQAKTEFVSLASHQLRTPLSAINWFAQMLEAGDAGELNDEQQVFIKQVLESNQRMVDLVDSLLNVSRIDLGTFAIEPEKLDLETVADSVISELEPKIEEKQQKLERHYHDDVPELMADPKLVRIIFQNLISNAVKYTGEKGSITVGITKKDSFVELMVADTGYGIPKHQHGQIFEKLFRADNVREMETDGTGLGLYIIKAIAEEVGGEAWFESEEGKGTTFHVTIPLSGMKKKVGNKELD